MSLTGENQMDKKRLSNRQRWLAAVERAEQAQQAEADAKLTRKRAEPFKKQARQLVAEQPATETPSEIRPPRTHTYGVGNTRKPSSAKPRTKRHPSRQVPATESGQ
jgi:hypothetical protein